MLSDPLSGLQPLQLQDALKCQQCHKQFRSKAGLNYHTMAEHSTKVRHTHAYIWASHIPKFGLITGPLSFIFDPICSLIHHSVVQMRMLLEHSGLMFPHCHTDLLTRVVSYWTPHRSTAPVQYEVKLALVTPCMDIHHTLLLVSAFTVFGEGCCACTHTHTFSFPWAILRFILWIFIVSCCALLLKKSDLGGSWRIKHLNLYSCPWSTHISPCSCLNSDSR